MNRETYSYVALQAPSLEKPRAMYYLEDYKLTPASEAYLKGSTKRLLDIAGASFGLLCGLPIVLIAAILIKWVDHGQVVFAQQRYGYGGKGFTLYKLRTLHAVDPHQAVLLENIQNKPNYETTRTGWIWRVTSIDEILQFWSVLKGEMSLIGYRPMPMYYLAHLRKLDGMNRGRLENYLKVTGQHKPGMSGLSSVNGRGDLTLQQRMEYDLIYAQHANFLLDLELLLRTIGAVLTRKGAK